MGYGLRVRVRGFEGLGVWGLWGLVGLGGWRGRVWGWRVGVGVGRLGLGGWGRGWGRGWLGFGFRV